MELIHSDATLKELAFLRDFDSFDAVVSQEVKAKLEDNSFSLTVSDRLWKSEPIRIGHYIYASGTEWGGQVEKIRHNTASKQVTVSGVTWRGALYRKVIVPPAGQNYLTITNKEANAAMRDIIGTQMGGAFSISTASSGVTIASKAFRYTNMLLGVEEMLEARGAALSISFLQQTKKATLSARAVVDYSDSIDLSQDYGIDMVTTLGGYDRFNHIIALGAGELEDRDILHVYRLDDGTLTTQQPAWHGTAADHVRTYDYTNPEDIDKLREGAEKILIENAPQNTVEIDPRVDELSLLLGDIVGARDRLTGMVAKVTVVGKALKMDSKGIRTETKVG